MHARPGAGAWSTAVRQPDDLLTGGSGATLTSRLDRWAADARVDDAAARRTRERWLRSAAEQDATLGGVLVDLAERGAAVAVSMAGGRRHRARIGAIGADFVALRPASGSEVLVARTAIAALRTLPAEDAATGERLVETELGLVEVLAQLAAERERVLVVTGPGDEHLAGEPRRVGHDVLVLRTSAEPPAIAYVPTAAITEVIVG